MTDRPGLDFSFSGLKTYCKNTLRDCGGDHATGQDRADIARAFEEAVVDTLVIKCRRAMKETGAGRLVVAGGVSANQLLRARLDEAMVREQVSVFYPALEYCTDNGAMIAYAGALRLAAGEREELPINIRARWPLAELDPPGWAGSG